MKKRKERPALNKQTVVKLTEVQLSKVFGGDGGGNDPTLKTATSKPTTTAQ